MRAVAAGADDVNQMPAVCHIHFGGELAHHLCRRRDLAYGFLLDAQAGQNSRHHQRRDVAAHDHAHELQHFIVKNFTVLDGALQSFAGSDGHTNSKGSAHVCR